jgi:hypothetical protein
MLPTKLRGVWHSRWNRLTGIRPDSTEILTPGGAMDPSALFTAPAIDIVNRIAGDCLAELGYTFPKGQNARDCFDRETAKRTS